MSDPQPLSPSYTRVSDQPIPFWKSPAFLIAVGIVSLKLYERVNVAFKLDLPVLNTDPQSVGSWVESTAVLIGAWIIAQRRTAVTPDKPQHPIEPIATTVRKLTDGNGKTPPTE